MDDACPALRLGAGFLLHLVHSESANTQVESAGVRVAKGTDPGTSKPVTPADYQDQADQKGAKERPVSWNFATRLRLWTGWA